MCSGENESSLWCSDITCCERSCCVANSGALLCIQCCLCVETAIHSVKVEEATHCVLMRLWAHLVLCVRGLNGEDA